MQDCVAIEKHNYINHLVMKKDGLDISRYDKFFLNKSVERRMLATNCSSSTDYSKLIEQSCVERHLFFDSLHVGYSEFFRNPLTFAVLEQIILPSLIIKNKNSSRKEMRIWSSACASGQEAYSVAILVNEQKKNFPQIDFRIFGTDKSEIEVKSAQKGAYPIASLNNLTMKRVDEWFDKADNIYTVKPELKKSVDFSVFDLFNEQLNSPPVSIYGDFDIIFCANLLFYYQDKYREFIIKKISKCLCAGGVLITGEAEREILISYNYHEIFPQSAIFQLNAGRRK